MRAGLSAEGTERAPDRPRLPFETATLESTRRLTRAVRNPPLRRTQGRAVPAQPRSSRGAYRWPPSDGGSRVPTATPSWGWTWSRTPRLPASSEREEPPARARPRPPWLGPPCGPAASSSVPWPGPWHRRAGPSQPPRPDSPLPRMPRVQDRGRMTAHGSHRPLVPGHHPGPVAGLARWTRVAQWPVSARHPPVPCRAPRNRTRLRRAGGPGAP
jgi:hypothetical protein